MNTLLMSKTSKEQLINGSEEMDSRNVTLNCHLYWNELETNVNFVLSCSSCLQKKLRIH